MIDLVTREQNLPDILRLRALKDIVGSQLRGRNDREIAEMQNPDLSGISQMEEPIAPSPSINESPENQSFDVRANRINVNDQKPDLMARLGSSLNSLVSNIGAEPLPEQEPSLNIPESAPTSNIPQFGSSSSYLSNDIARSQPQPQPEQPQLSPEKALQLKSTIDPRLLDRVPEYKQRLDAAVSQAPSVQDINKRIDEAAQNPGQSAVFGATQVVRDDPIKRQAFEQITEQNFSDEIANQLSKYEKVLDSVTNTLSGTMNTLDESEQKIRDRLQTGQTTTQDKILIGLALAMPLIAAGLIGGKEALFGALAGGAKGLSTALDSRNKQRLEDEESLKNIALKKSDLAGKQLEVGLSPIKLREDLAKSIPKDERGALLKGRRRIVFERPDGSISEGVEILPDVIAKPQFLNDKEDKTRMIKSGEELANATQGVKLLNEVTQNISEIASQLNIPASVISQAGKNLLANKKPDLTPLLGQTIDYKGRKVNAAVELEQQLGLLVDAYRVMKGMRALTSTVDQHISNIFANPLVGFTTAQDLINQMVSLRDLGQATVREQANLNGFYPEFIDQALNEQNKSLQKVLNSKSDKEEYNRLMGKKNG